MDLIGRTLDGKYRIVEQIGRGGMASVFKAYQPALDRYVAIKVLPAEHALAPGFSERFVREARAVAQLNHPNILPVIDFGQEEGLSYIVMKYVASGTLKDRLGRPMDLTETTRIIEQIAAALDHAHGRGILHRDVKASNVLLDEGGWVQLADFGLAKILAGDEGLTATGVGIGTPAYMSPEQGQGRPVDHRTDIYSLGVVLYEMVTGRLPYDAETPMAIVFKHIYEPMPLPRQVNRALPEEVERVIFRAMAKTPADRYHSAGEMARALQQAVAKPSPIAEVSATEGAVEGRATQVIPPSAEKVLTEAPSVSKGRPWLLFAGGAAAVLLMVVVLLAVGVIAFFALKGGKPGPTAVGGSLQSAATPTGELMATLPAEQTPTATREPTQPPTATSRPMPTEDAQAYIKQGQASLKAGDAETAISHFSRAIELDAKSAEAYVGRGDAYSELAQFEQALPDYIKAIELDPGYARAYAGRCYAYFQLDDHDQAIADCTKAIELDPNDAIVYRNRGLNYFHLDDYDRAIGDFTQAIQLDPDYADAYYWRGHNYYWSGDYDRAIADYSKAIELKFDPLGWPYNARGRVYYALGDYDRAIADHTQAIELGPDYSLFLYYRDRGDAYYGRDDYEQAIADYTQAIEINPNDAYAYYWRGAAYYSQDDYDQAIADYTKAIEISPDDADAYYWRGAAYYSQGDYDQAIADYTQAIQLDPDNADAYYWRGVSYQERDEKEKAIADFKRVLELETDPNRRAQAEERLRELGQ